MTAYELRSHLAAAHATPTRGLPYGELVVVHDTHHAAGLADHHHVEQLELPQARPVDTIPAGEVL